MSGSKNGAEFEVGKIHRVLREFSSINDHLVYLFRLGREFGFKRQTETSPRVLNTLKDLRGVVEGELRRRAVNLIHLHSMPYTEITDLILDLGLPVVRSSHEPMLTCPGWARFLSSENSPCDRQFGLGCVVNGYTKRCQRSRHPLKMIEAYRNVYLEINKFIPRYSRLVVNSNYLAKTLLDHGATPKQVVVVPSPQFEKASQRGKGLQTESVSIIYAGRITQAKGVFVLLDAFRKLKSNTNKDCSLEFVGEGSASDELKCLVAEHSIKDVYFHGWIDRGRLTEMFAQDGIAVTPSVYPDHFPNVVAEAMLSGIAVVASDSGGTSEWFENGISGMSYDYRSPEQLESALRLLLEDGSFRRKLGAAGQDWIRANHSPERVARTYLRLYEEVLCLNQTSE